MNYFKLSISKGQQITEALKIEDRIDREIACLSILSGKPSEYYESMPLADLEKAIAKTGWLSTMPDPRKAKPFTHGNHFYLFKTGAAQLSKWEFAMLQKYSEDWIGNLHYILALLSQKYRIFPFKKLPTNPDEFERRAAMFREKMSFGLAYGYAVFFSTYYPSLLDAGQSYLEGVQRAVKESGLIPS